MKQRLLLIAILFSYTISYGQYDEFKVYPSGLMYSDSTMGQLKFIVDSLNLKFKRCDLNKIYYSKYQTKAHYVYLENGYKQAIKDLENNISFKDFVTKYPKAGVHKDLLLVKYRYKNYQDKEEVEFSSVSLNNKHGFEIIIEDNPEIYEKNSKGSWIIDVKEKNKYSKGSLSAFYLVEDFTKKPIDNNYARMVQYTDCMIDTTTQIFTNKDEGSDLFETSINSPKVKKFMEYVHKETNMPVYDKEHTEEYYDKLHKWDSLKYRLIDSLLIKQEAFHQQLKEAVIEALDKGGSYGEFENYV